MSLRPSTSTLIDLLVTQQARFEAFPKVPSASLVEISESKFALVEDIRLPEEKRSAAVCHLASNRGCRRKR